MYYTNYLFNNNKIYLIKYNNNDKSYNISNYQY